PPPQWNGSVIERFHRWVREAPELAAVVDNQDTWTYGALATASRAVADQLRALGTEPGDWILIQGQRDPSLIWALLGIMQTGARFTILDGEEPAARFLACLGTSDVDPGLMPHPPRGVVQLADPCDPTASPDRTLEEALDQAFFLRLPRRPEASSRSEHRYATSAPNALPAVDPDAPAYVAFTSGSSGRPKGIVGSQRPLAHFLDWSCSTFGFGPGDRFSLLSGLAHDPLLRDIFTPLVCGGTVSIPPPGWRRQPETLAAWLRDAKITVTHLAPAWGQLLLATGSPGPMHLEQVFFGGEALSIKLADRFARWAPNARINNFYGATETPQAIAWHAIAATPTLPVAKSAGEENRAYSTTTAPIGRGIDGVELHVMAPSGQPAGIGERGEIWVRTPYLALGYRNAEPTNGFIINPVTGDPSDRLYRTGDFGYIQPDGSVQYLGRGDDQMSIRGFRVEPAEIAAVALGHPAVRDIAVVGRPSETGASRLVVYVEPEEGATLSTVELRHFLADRLPPYMIPVACVVLDCLPRNARGKVDRDALPEPADVEPRRLGVPPRNSDERTVADIFEHLLEVRGVQATDEFFSLGGHSLQTILLVEKLVERFGRRLPLSTVFRAATVERLAALMRLPAAPTSSSFDTDASPLVALQTGGQQTPLFFVHAIGGTAMAYRELAGALGDRRPFYGLEARDSIGATLETMAHQYLDALRHVTPRGPYLLGGWSFGGVLAFEMARQIEAAGETVDLLLLVDAFAPRLDDRRQVSEQDLRAAFHRDLARQGGLPEGIDASLFEPYFAIFRSHHEAILRYHPAGPVAARTLLFEASERPDLPPLVEGWRPWLRSEPTVEQVAGDHYSLLSLPSVTTLASRIAASLNARTFQPRAATGTRPHER
ncbi:MAG: AMP-binding protein, partial [Acidobacteriota bacterium]